MLNDNPTCISLRKSFVNKVHGHIDYVHKAEAVKYDYFDKHNSAIKSMKI